MEDQATKAIQHIEVAMIAHNRSDDERFGRQDQKLDKIIVAQQEFREMQLVNHEVIKTIKVDTGKTNGRVLLLEGLVKELSESNAKLTQIVSFHHNQYENFVKQQELLGKDFVTQVEFSPIKKIVQGGVTLILTAVMGALLGLVLIKTK